MAWTGFTDEQLNALKRQTSEEEIKTYASRGRAQGQHSQRGRGRPSGPNRGRARTVPNQSGRHGPVSEDQMLSRPRQPLHQRGKPISREEHVWSHLNDPTPPQAKPSPARKKPPPAPVSGEAQSPSAPAGGNNPPPSSPADDRHGEVDEKEEVLDGKKQEKEEEKMKILDESEGQVRELSKLEEFQKKQRQMEEENAKKKNLLARAIADRKKKTQAEAKRLAYIQKELAEIENLLTNDVNILRDKIETASRDFNEAQRRYDKAEAEFVAAKIHLHKTSEMKEALTEHLCTIIHENEMRKAKKLEELVSKLDVESLAEFENIPDETAIPPTSPTSPIPSAPQQTVAVNNPAENSGNVPNSSPVGDAVAPVGKDDSTSSSGEPASVGTEGQDKEQDVSNTTTSSAVENKDSDRTEIVPAGQSDELVKDVRTSEETESTPANEQPEAEQHVAGNVDQT